MMDKSKAMILLLLFASNTIYGLASPFLPTFFEDRGISSTWTGMIFAAYAIASTIVSLLSGKCLDKVGHNKIMLFGGLLMSASIVSFGLITRIESNVYLIAVAIFLRVCQGKFNLKPHPFV